LLIVSQQETDSLGQFVFPELYFYDTIYVSLKAENSRGKTATTIEIDSSSSISPKSEYLPYFIDYKGDEPIEILTYLSETKSNLIKKKWSLNDTILIDDVNVVARKKVMDDGLFRIYKEADIVIDSKKLEYEVGTIFEAVDGKIAGLRKEIIKVGYEEKEVFMYRGYVVSLYLDSNPIKYEDLSTFPSNAFDKIEFIKYAPFAGLNKAGGVLFFYSKRGMKNVKPASIKPQGMEGFRVIGYSVSRRFYTPDYNLPEESEKKADYRNTIYWNPVVRTDSTGVAISEFYNSDETGNMKIVVEGVTSDGKLCRGVSNYNVKH
jgi:hypothetical protein